MLRLWEGLGYYRRARDLHRAARILVADHDSRFPDDPAILSSLPGLGRYTCNAVLSQAFDRRLPILEANSQRVLSRLFGRVRGSASGAGAPMALAGCGGHSAAARHRRLQSSLDGTGRTDVYTHGAALHVMPSRGARAWPDNGDSKSRSPRARRRRRLCASRKPPSWSAAARKSCWYNGPRADVGPAYGNFHMAH